MLKKLICKTITTIGCLGLLLGNIAIMPASLIFAHEPNCPDEFLR
ncbi:cyclic lactone autoinducer peptide [Clostridium estertheticum]|uniref:Cyclic lactone autoinducer peptide n=1 Tax=Clostridium estertheticum TaxID=238834 RepID=A0A7Y3T378_9CLOT|nr:cyclic lactone autoinducer peptide [Clostridium estertheticum]NNU78469.1 cyclic lactone autoinducer peptide [Clostridium estertheticum]WBL49427.1 cyclic lactone autoinducer peptide [Clostridium estertheticum]